MNLNDIKSKIGKAAGNTQFLVILLIAVLFIIASLFIYRRSIVRDTKNKYVTNNEFSNKPTNITSADIYLFYTEWCPHCKTAKPIWADFKSQMSGKTVNGITLIFHEVDCDKDTATSDKFKVKGFPTIKLMKGNQMIEYDAKPTTANLIEFVNTSLA
jgi:thiol-disulfide isomerase/thioredoxin